MNDYPFLSLNNIAIDPALARQLPRRLAYYYLALPLARDGEEITVVMAHPDNPAAVAVLEAVLGGRVVVVQGAAPEVRAALDRLWSGETDLTTRRVLSWASSPERAAFVASVADRVACALSAQTFTLDASRVSPETALTVAREDQYTLAVIDTPQSDALTHALHKASTPVLLVRGAHLGMCRILLTLRGHSSDESVLDWGILLSRAGQAQTTLLAVAPSPARGSRRGVRPAHGLATLLSTDDEPGEHIAACARRLVEAGAQGALKLREGVPEEQIAVEASQGEYDLVIIAAEARGDFVSRVLRQIENQATPNHCCVLVVKPLVD
ncbi:MAG: hypothetical protein Kow00120_23390 [Anaerolineae bacterium]